MMAVSPDTALDAKDTALKNLPRWNLDDLYPGMGSAAFAQAMSDAAAQAEAFKTAYEGKVTGLDGDDLAAALATYEQLQDLLGRVMSYASLLHAGDMDDPKIGQFYQTTQEQVT